MASFSATNASANLAGRELSIASTFVKQYYTLLNKAPCFIHNFYSHDSTFIHGTIETASESYTEPIVGREKIKKKMEDLKLNDCRAKIKQIDCLATLAGGLVIQVIGELSNNGKPMRSFLQTFVLAPSPDEARQDDDSQNMRGSGDQRRGTQTNENNSQAHNQKFYVLNSIFRYQDDGSYSEFEDETIKQQSSATTDNSNGGPEVIKASVNEDALKPTAPVSGHGRSMNGPVSDQPLNRRRPHDNVRITEEVEKLNTELEETVKINKTDEIETKRDIGAPRLVVNGTGNADKKIGAPEKTNENGKNTTDYQTTNEPSNNSGNNVSGNNHPMPSTTASRPQPSNEPKTWANMVRNAHPAPIPLMNVSKVAPTEQHQSNQQSSNATMTPQAQSSLQSQQSSPPQTQPPQLQQQQQQTQQQQQQSQQQPTQQQLLTQLQQQPQQPPQQQGNSQNSIGNNRRRNMMRKPTNKAPGRALKNRAPRPPASKPMA